MILQMDTKRREQRASDHPNAVTLPPMVLLSRHDWLELATTHSSGGGFLPLGSAMLTLLPVTNVPQWM
jgi:hypothetical protein